MDGRVNRRPATTLLVVGIHREERAFGEAVAATLDGEPVDVLVIPEGLSGRRPRPDQHFHYDVLHRELYLQLVPYAAGRYALLVDLHTGRDAQGPSADLISGDAGLLAELRSAIARDAALTGREIGFVALGEGAATNTRTVIPRKLWDHSKFRYLGIETYLPDSESGRREACSLASRLVAAAARCVGTANRATANP